MKVEWKGMKVDIEDEKDIELFKKLRENGGEKNLVDVAIGNRKNKRKQKQKHTEMLGEFKSYLMNQIKVTKATANVYMKE